ncbi:hypothetical protein [Nocardia seriolae]|nr:hypothetical protein [Nocardia seriolae]MTJ63128.1 hypothetical protein [Nocardia seriolae]MTJ73548.1 hypothetical protein [Nocardia seriolae]MTJ89065.1 hypothetical protein [Nocardia seriolae]MTK33044.1 hypothetical protein [Nocardia seriolae]MTK41022.1 hypothetical protein [Nocardia seriolae]
MMPMAPNVYGDPRNKGGDPRNTDSDPRNLPGPILAAAGIISIALTLTTAGYGSPVWAGLCAVTSVLCLRFGIGLMIIEHRRVKAAKRRRSTHQGRV